MNAKVNYENEPKVLTLYIAGAERWRKDGEDGYLIYYEYDLNAGAVYDIITQSEQKTIFLAEWHALERDYSGEFDIFAIAKSIAIREGLCPVEMGFDNLSIDIGLDNVSKDSIFRLDDLFSKCRIDVAGKGIKR